MHLAFLNSGLVLPRFAYPILYVLCPCQFLLSIWDARTQQNAHRTCVRHTRDTSACASVLRPVFFFFVSRLASTRVKSGRSAPIRVKLVRIGRNHQYLRQPANSIRNSKKKKKKVRNAPFGRNNNKRCKMHHLDKNNKTLYHL